MVKADNMAPQWQQKIQIPVYVPTLNEKIKIILWHEGGTFFSEDVFMANVPEFPSANDLFNTSTLQNKEGLMNPTWFNLYGIRPKEQRAGMPKFGSNAFLGRVLMSFHMIQSNRPVLAVGTGQTPGKLEDENYILWIDVFELVNCDELIKQQSKLTKVTVQAYINGKVSQKSQAKKNDTDVSLRF